MECDYLYGWIKKTVTFPKNLTKNGEPPRYTWGTQQTKKKGASSSLILYRQPVLALILLSQVSGKVTTREPTLRSLVFSSSSSSYRLVGLVVRCPPPERKIPGSNPACTGIFSGSSHTSDLKIGAPVATLPGASRYRVSTGTGRPGVSIL